MFNIGQRQIEKMARQMGIRMENIQAEQVIIRTKDKEILIDSPAITKIKLAGQETFQIAGKVIERPRFSAEDVQIVMSQAGVSEAEARAALEAERDIAAAILKLKG